MDGAGRGRGRPAERWDVRDPAGFPPPGDRWNREEKWGESRAHSITPIHVFNASWGMHIFLGPGLLEVCTWASLELCRATRVKAEIPILTLFSVSFVYRIV